MNDLRVGLGVDAHAFDPDTKLVLAGIFFPDEPGLAGHSDGDVLAHALTDALLGAAGLSDIGSFFPSSDSKWKDADSIDLLIQAFEVVKKSGFELVNADCVLIGQRPQIVTYQDSMRARLAGALGVDSSRITVRATTTDRLGFTGREEGLAAQAIALLEKNHGPT
tara:strand:+ start:52 stop:546 length:495 start_codon:yes stop_codon:yes gene_type:complete